MARARNIKPSFFTNDVLAEIPMAGRLLFVGLWTLADRAGRLEDRPKRIKAEVLPYDDVDIDRLLDELSGRGFILRYEVGGNRFIQVLAFDKHQHPHVKEPASTIPAPDKPGASPVPIQPDDPPGDVSGDSPQDPHKQGHQTSPVLAPDKPGAKTSDSGFLIPDCGLRIADSSSLALTARATPADLTRAMRESGVEAQPADPRLIALAERGVSPDTMRLACDEAKRAKPGERISPGYVVAVVEGWASRASALKANAATGPPASPDRNADFVARLDAAAQVPRRPILESIGADDGNGAVRRIG